MRSHAPKVKRNETMTLSDRKHFAAMIRSGAKYRVRVEHKDVMFNGNNVQLLRKEYDTFVMYYSKKSILCIYI